jgi:hypothetical protein
MHRVFLATVVQITFLLGTGAYSNCASQFGLSEELIGDRFSRPMLTRNFEVWEGRPTWVRVLNQNILSLYNNTKREISLSENFATKMPFKGNEEILSIQGHGGPKATHVNIPSEDESVWDLLTAENIGHIIGQSQIPTSRLQFVILYVCFAGFDELNKQNISQTLANHLGTPVLAPVGRLLHGRSLKSDGRSYENIFLIRNLDGSHPDPAWRLFFPSKFSPNIHWKAEQYQAILDFYLNEANRWKL